MKVFNSLLVGAFLTSVAMGQQGDYADYQDCADDAYGAGQDNLYHDYAVRQQEKEGAGVAG